MILMGFGTRHGVEPSLFHRFVSDVLEALDAPPPTLLVHGGASGIDAQFDEWAKRKGIPTRVFPADWSKGRRGGPVRNRQMVEFLKEQDGPALAIGFMGENSKGSLNSFKLLEKARIPCVVFTIDYRPPSVPTQSSFEGLG